MKGQITDQTLLLEDYQQKIVVLDKKIALFKKILVVVSIAMLLIFLISV